ncbi:MAG: M48 family metallopeptidase [Acidobacteria bacterium]|nr:M48 family metallopeptidase [Acidobacteriota bacterium]
MLGLIIIVVLLFLLFNPKLLPHIGTWLGGRSRKPYRQAKWMWTSFAGSEDEAIRAEREYGRECSLAFAAQFPAKASKADQAFVESIGSRLAGAAKDPRRRFDFMVAESAPANAFALPGGFIFITTSLLDLCARDRDEVAFFLGHEIGHVVHGHARDRMTADTFLKAVSARLPAAGRMIGEVVRKGYSQEQEMEADREAIRLAAGAGFNARASLSAMKRLEKVAADPSGFAEYLSSHPPLAERLRRLEISLG